MTSGPAGSPGHVFDVGLQAERTALAWRRTTLALALGAVTVGRLATPVFGVWGLALAAVGLLQALLVAGAAARRYRATHHSLTERGDLTGVRQAGLPIAVLTCSCLVIGVLALVVVLGERFSGR
ncbi:DUF202 domain-containing protein [Klenkia sp. PcliD-1-E]|uniref:DUF202 domain-containing protein n=1 Tax=Klenkia sp. PcliD-1-E TaxID=2954492 RepID=UPI002096DC1F|nr:DUF202 domain-containing protein [Klenkia sp. PcliD-1-E]MCO7218453.1 DUF202 domain-containing protein [Klenkia sp. PcliD-1-E]